MRTVERFQNPVVNDIVNLRLIFYNSNNYSNVNAIRQVEIYKLNCDDGTETLVETIDGADVQNVDTGMYLLPLTVGSGDYTEGKYVDRWYVTFAGGDTEAIINNSFEIYSSLWYATVIPAVYSFDFRFQPNRLRAGSKRWLIIQVLPNVPRATDLERYYTNLAISSTLKISIAKNCGPCIPEEDDLRLVVDEDNVDVREKVFGYYLLDTADMDCGIYDVWFTLEYAGNIDISTKQQLQIF